MKTRSETQQKQLDHILKAVYKHCDIGRDAILDRYRHPKLILVRKAIWTVLYEKHNWSMTEIGKVFLRTHPSISRGISDFRIKSERKEYKEILSIVKK
ncbi:MAG: hypothetical protein KAS04_01280 [Candidatus Aenigmarchaeota archaeon]|nr:hypothetical protein [Candidatus Aenigmarchaeota archaeon]